MATFKTEFTKRIVNIKDDTINIFVHGDLIYSAQKNNVITIAYNTTYSAPNNRWMNENELIIPRSFVDYTSFKNMLASRLFTILPEDKDDKATTPPVRFRTVKNKVYLEVYLETQLETQLNKWYKIAVIEDNLISPKQWTIKFYNIKNQYAHIGINHCGSTDAVVKEFLHDIHLDFFPSKLKAWLEARTLAKVMANSDNDDTTAYGVYTSASGSPKFIGSTQPVTSNTTPNLQPIRKIRYII